MNDQHIGKIAGELNLAQRHIKATATLLDEGATVPFIARYRKEVTGSLDEYSITAIRDRLEQMLQLDGRREAILHSLEERGLLTDALKDQLNAAKTMAVLEDLVLPLAPSGEREPPLPERKALSHWHGVFFLRMASTLVNFNPFGEASGFIDVEKGVHSPEEALAGARDIIAEWISEDAPVRSSIRDLLLQKARFSSKVLTGKEGEGVKYRDDDYWEEPVRNAPSHRILAMRRGEREGFLQLRLVAPHDEALALLRTRFVKGDNPASGQVQEALEDGYQRLLFPSMETEVRTVTKERADEEAIRVFAENLRQLLRALPLGEKNVLAIDPGFRAGCKVVLCLDRQGKLLHTDTIFPHKSQKERSEAAETVIELCGRFHVEAIAVGNGTAGRETETFLNGLGLSRQVQIISVNESGASVYSASEAARDEFPDRDLTVRGAVSIGRRLLDPLAELVKIDPKSIGVANTSTMWISLP